ncbi:MAG: hypothetical protein ACOH5I_24080 [Oligoflexus sp.]
MKHAIMHAWRRLSRVVPKLHVEAIATSRILALLFTFSAGPQVYSATNTWQVRIIDYRPLTLNIGAGSILRALNEQLQELALDEFVENKVKFRLLEPHAYLEGNGKVLIRTKIIAETKVPIIGKIKADARAKLWLHVSLDDWQSQVVATDTDIRFSNDVINLAFLMVRSRIENRIIELSKKSLESLNQSIQPGSSKSLKMIQERGRLDGKLETDGFWIYLRSRSNKLSEG